MRYLYEGHTMRFNAKELKQGDEVEIAEDRAKQLARSGMALHRLDGGDAVAARPHPRDIPEVQPVAPAKAATPVKKSDDK
jgi:hypothetical protein